MPYTSRYGRRPDEYASKSSHSYIINDPSVQEFLSGCELPKKPALLGTAFNRQRNGQCKMCDVGLIPRNIERYSKIKIN